MRYLLNLLFFAVIVSSGAFVFSTQASAQGCTALVEVDTIPESSTEFPYTVAGDNEQEFVLEAFDPGRKIFIPLGGLITVTQRDVPGWVLRDISCETPIREIDAVEEAERFIGPGVNAFVSGSTVTLTCDDEAGFTNCTFNNAQAEVVPTMSQWGILALVVALAAAAFFVMYRRKVSA